MVAGIAAVLPLIAACKSNVDTPAEAALAPNGSTTGSQSDSARNTNAIAGIRILPQQLTLSINGSASVSVVPVDANGIPSLALLASAPVLTVSNSAVASINTATHNIIGIAAGTTKLYATLGALKDSIVVTVTTQRDTTTTGNGNPTTPTVPSSPVPVFTLTVYAFGRAIPVSARDTANVVQLAGATISVYKLSQNSTVPSDTFGIRTLVKTVVADGNGKAVVTDLASGYYSIAATATYQGAAMEGQADFGPPRQADFSTAIYLNRK